MTDKPTQTRKYKVIQDFETKHNREKYEKVKQGSLFECDEKYAEYLAGIGLIEKSPNQ